MIYGPLLPNGMVFSEYYSGTLHRTMRQLARMRISEADAEDVAQEAYAKLLKCYGGFRDESAFDSWFYRIIQNTARDFIRRRNRNSTEPLEKEHEEAFSHNPEEFYERSINGHLMPAIVAAVSQLPPEQRVSFLLYADDVTFSEISRMQGTNISTEKTRTYLAIKSIKKRLNPNIVRDIGYDPDGVRLKKRH